MAFLKAFGSYLPPRIVTNAEIAALVGCEADWILNMSGIEERRFAAEDESVADLAFQAAVDCLKRAGTTGSEIGMLLVASGSSERRFPGPAATVAHRLGLGGVPALDLPMASAGSLFALALATRMCADYGDVLVIGAEKMSSVATRPPLDRNVAILFGDGAGACLLSRQSGAARIIGSVIRSDGSFADALKLEFDQPLQMNGGVVILQASRKIPAGIDEVLKQHGRRPDEVGVFLVHQANRNLIVRVARALNVPAERFYSNIGKFGNTSSASMLIAAAEWSSRNCFLPGVPVVFAGFGAGFHWGAVLAEGV